MYRSMADPAFSSNPAALTGQGWSASIPGSPLASDHTSDDPWSGGTQVGYFGLALTNRQRIRKNVDKLVRLHRRRLRVEREIIETESKLDMLGEDVDGLYADLGLEPIE